MKENSQKLQLALSPLSIPAPKKAGVTGKGGQDILPE